MKPLVVTAENGVRQETLNNFRRYVMSHPQDARIAEGVDDGTPMRVHITVGGDGISREEKDGEHVFSISQNQADVVLEVRKIRETVHGASLTPGLYSVFKKGVLDFIESSEQPVSVREISEKFNPDDPDRNLGYLYVTMKSLALQGWLSLSGRDGDARVQITKTGRIALKVLREHKDEYAFAVATIDTGKEYYKQIRQEKVDDSVVAEWRKLVDKVRAGWNLPTSEDKTTKRVIRHMRRHLDGRAILPISVALGMPKYEFKGKERVTLAPAFFELFYDNNNEVDLATLTKQFHPKLLQAGIDLFTHFGVFEERDEGSTILKLTQQGRAYVDGRVPTYSGAPVSYSLMFTVMDDMHFGKEPDPLGMPDDNHVDRLVNIWGIQESVSLRRAKTVCRDVLSHIFNNLPLDEQPAGLADMGCGAGGTLLTMAEYVINKTERGKNLDRYPLFVIGADYSEVSRSSTRETLRALDGIAGVTTEVVFGDVTDPDRLDRTIQELGFQCRDGKTGELRTLGAGDILHSQFHLTHDRFLRVENEDHALQILKERLPQTNKRLLKKAIEASLGHSLTRLPDNDDELLDLVQKQFHTSFAVQGKLVPAVVAAADLVQFLQRWGNHCEHGLIIVDLHTPRAEVLVEDIPDDIDDWMRIEKISLQSWNHQALSDQYPTPYFEHALCCVLAGLELVDDKIYPDGLFTPQVRQFMERGNGWYKPASAE